MASIYKISTKLVHHFLQSIGIICVLFLSIGCEYDPIEPAFGYIYINSASLETTELQGQNTSAITEAWVAVNNEEIGTYQIPGIIPIPSGEDIEITIFPGVRKNDRIDESVRYPMYQEIKLILDIKSEKIDSLDLIYHYKDNVNIALLEDFEKGNGFLNNLDTAQSTVSKIINVNSTNDQHGSFIGTFTLDEFKNHIFLGHKTLTGDLKKGKSPVWLEIDSKSEHIFSLILRGFRPNQSETRDEIARIFPTDTTIKDEWGKTYFDLTEVINTRRLDVYELVIFSIFEHTDEKQKVEFQLDNIKILHL